MGWRFVQYREAGESLALAIEPMVSGEDLVYVPDTMSWRERAPAAFRDRREEILNRLRSVRWNRELKWQDGGSGFSSAEPVPGSLKSTRGGAEFEAKNFFAPGSELTFEQARFVWITLERRFAMQVTGKVTIFVERTIPNSVFQAVVRPTLRKNSQAALDIRQVGPENDGPTPVEDGKER